jgi:hypothetical protein
MNMLLTREDEAMLNGEYGQGPEIAMSILVKLGEMYGADRMLKIENVHIDGAAYARAVSRILQEFAYLTTRSGGISPIYVTACSLR